MITINPKPEKASELGSSLRSPEGYPEAPQVDVVSVVRNSPIEFGSNDMGFDILESCPRCNLSFPPVGYGNQVPSLAQHMQQHSTGYIGFDEGSDFGQDKEL